MRRDRVNPTLLVGRGQESPPKSSLSKSRVRALAAGTAVTLVATLSITLAAAPPADASIEPTYVPYVLGGHAEPQALSVAVDAPSSAVVGGAAGPVDLSNPVVARAVTASLHLEHTRDEVVSNNRKFTEVPTHD